MVEAASVNAFPSTTGDAFGNSEEFQELRGLDGKPVNQTQFITPSSYTYFKEYPQGTQVKVMATPQFNVGPTRSGEVDIVAQHFVSAHNTLPYNTTIASDNTHSIAFLCPISAILTPDDAAAAAAKPSDNNFKLTSLSIKSINGKGDHLYGFKVFYLESVPDSLKLEHLKAATTRPANDCSSSIIAAPERKDVPNPDTRFAHQSYDYTSAITGFNSLSQPHELLQTIPDDSGINLQSKLWTNVDLVNVDKMILDFGNEITAQLKIPKDATGLSFKCNPIAWHICDTKTMNEEYTLTIDPTSPDQSTADKITVTKPLYYQAEAEVKKRIDQANKYVNRAGAICILATPILTGAAQSPIHPHPSAISMNKPQPGTKESGFFHMKCAFALQQITRNPVDNEQIFAS